MLYSFLIWWDLGFVLCKVIVFNIKQPFGRISYLSVGGVLHIENIY